MWNRILHRLRLAWELPFSDWLVLLEAWWALLVYYWRLRFTSFERLSKSSQPALKGKDGILALAQRIQHLVGWASHLHLLNMTCLVQSLSVRWMLQRRGIASEIRIGAVKTPAGIHAHAWVEVDGQVIGDTTGADAAFSVLGARR